MKKSKAYGVLGLVFSVLALLGLGVLFAVDKQVYSTDTEIKSESYLPDLSSKEIKTTYKMPTITEFTKLLMEDCKSSYGLSEAKKYIVLNQIVRAAETHLSGLEQYAFVGLLCLETRVGKLPTGRNVSTAGATGIAQLMPSTAKEESKRCGYGELKLPDDLQDNELNLLISACHFKKLVHDHGIGFAPLAYNAGPAAESVKRAKALMPPAVLETAGYSAIHGIILTRYLLEPMAKEAFKSMPKETKIDKVEE